MTCPVSVNPTRETLVVGSGPGASRRRGETGVEGRTYTGEFSVPKYTCQASSDFATRLSAT